MNGLLRRAVEESRLGISLDLSCSTSGRAFEFRSATCVNVEMIRLHSRNAQDEMRRIILVLKMTETQAGHCIRPL